MKVILFGATGFVGKALLSRAIQDPALTSIVVVSRRPLDDEFAKSAKVETVIVTDLNTYSDDVLEKLGGAEACLWSIGGRVQQFPDWNSANLANVVYLHAAAKMLVEKIAPGVKDKSKFRFVYCSGAFTERDQNKKLWFLEGSRKMKGEAESGLLEIEKEHGDIFEVIIARPAGILETNSGLTNVVYGSTGIGKGYLAYAMIDMAVNGAADKVTENAGLRTLGQKLAKQDSIQK